MVRWKGEAGMSWIKCIFMNLIVFPDRKEALRAALGALVCGTYVMLLQIRFDGVISRG